MHIRWKLEKPRGFTAVLKHLDRSIHYASWNRFLSPSFKVIKPKFIWWELFFPFAIHTYEGKILTNIDKNLNKKILHEKMIKFAVYVKNAKNSIKLWHSDLFSVIMNPVIIQRSHWSTYVIHGTEFLRCSHCNYCWVHIKVFFLAIFVLDWFRSKT